MNIATLAILGLISSTEAIKLTHKARVMAQAEAEAQGRFDWMMNDVKQTCSAAENRMKKDDGTFGLSLKSSGYW